MTTKTKNWAMLASGLLLLVLFLQTLYGLLFGSLPHLSGATLGCVLSLLGGLGLIVWALLRMGLVEVVAEEESSRR